MKKEDIKTYLRNIILKIQQHKALAVGVILLIVLLVGIALRLTKSDEKTEAAAQQVWRLADNIRNYYRNRPDAWGLNSTTTINEGIAPQDMSQDNQLLNILGKGVMVGGDINGSTVMPGSRSFVIIYKNLNERECREIATAKITEKEQLSLTSMIIRNEKDTHFIWGGENPLPISVKDAKKSCRKNNIIAWFLYI